MSQRRQSFASAWKSLEGSFKFQNSDRLASTEMNSRRDSYATRSGFESIEHGSRRSRRVSSSFVQESVRRAMLDVMDYRLSRQSVLKTPGKGLVRILAALFPMYNDCIHPECPQLSRWSVLVGACMTYLLYIYPFFVAFIKLRPITLPYAILDGLVTIVFVCDIIIHMNTGYVDDFKFSLIMDRKKARARYIWSPFGVFDFVSCFPAGIVAYVVHQVMSPVSERWVVALQVMFLVRLLKGFRAVHLDAVLSGELFNFNRGSRHLVRLILMIPLFSNAVACFWNVLAQSNVRHEWSEDIRRAIDQDGEVVTIYIASFYWAVSTLTSVGFGDLVPAALSEYTYATLACFASSVISGLTIAFVSTVVTDRHDAAVFKQAKLDSVQSYLSYRKVPAGLRKRILDYYTALVQKRADFDERSILESLTTDLKRDLSTFILQETLEDLDIFRGILNSELIVNLIECLKPATARKGDEIIRAGDPALEMYFLLSGHVEILTDENHDQIVLANLGPGNHFGELSLNRYGNELHSVTVRARSKCDLFILSRQTLLQLTQKFPEIKARLRQQHKRRVNVFNNLRLESKAQKMVLEKHVIDHVAEALEESGDLLVDTDQQNSFTGHQQKPTTVKPHHMQEGVLLKMLSINTNYVKTSLGIPPSARSAASNNNAHEFSAVRTRLKELASAVEQRQNLINQLRVLVQARST